jgi:hypothetical protein
MVASFTPNIQLTEPARGDDVGTWDVPVNGNATILDLIAGAIATIPLNNSNVVLSAAQFQSKQITFSSTLTGSVTITFPTTFIKSYEIQHLCTGSSAFTITLETTATGQVIAVPPGQIIDVVNDGSNLKFKGLPHVGSFWDYYGSSVPNWVGACTVPPYLTCNATTFSSGTYPVLFGLLGSTTTPDLRGRSRYMLDGGVGRVSSANSGVPGNTLGGAGGDQNLAAHSHGVNDPQHTHGSNAQAINTGGNAQGGGTAIPNSVSATINSALTGITIQTAGSGGGANMPPVLVSGLMMIRAA